MHLGRKFVAFILALVAVVIAAYFHLDITVGIASLYGIYCAGNVSQKIGTGGAKKDEVFSEHNE